MIGRIDSERTSYITVEIKEAGGEHEFVVDTGFNGFLYLPEDKAVEWKLDFMATAPMVLADQSILIAEIFEATAVWFTVSHRVPVVVGPPGCDSLLGMQFLRGCSIKFPLLLPFVYIEQLP